ncbi:uncharacterized protein CC84DRAFT_1200657 [Paraphaeosphaeria sporulosa]|uniref:Uncharacterized protein n=1 Tax=Paraphaeosphaeria sporulosa TaxID=1460663 RepID=A0A177CUY3_9PLEO|nr:uncharacterized protein CC84DRAFT_1200657 [Paraphaeosphaeria sporulosa]OAG11365.1 hypothetical protein CC84DRAFT_1200657 [Paraphaeosphaeria sporulosa]
MPALSRTSLASIVCPSAPFLAPRLLRTCAPLAALSLQPWALPTPSSRRYMSDKKPSQKLQYRKRQGLQQLHHGHVALLQQFRKAINDDNLRSLMDLYPSVLSTGYLTRDDTRRIAKTLHALLRTRELPDDTKPHLLSFLQQFVKDLQKGALPVHPIAFVHILGIYKERKLFNEGYQLWQWVVQQDDNHVTQAVYGAAIELMAYGKKLRLPELENLYLDALKRFPGTFAEYHLSPDAIVPNRAQPIAIANVPVTLLQGILTARILHNDWKQSYLALDTALRLYPCQLPSRFFEVFMESRQLPEAYTVFLVACRAGVVTRPSQITSILSRIRSSMVRCDSLRDRIVLLRAMANALYANLEAGGNLEPIHVGQFLTSFASLLPEPAPGSDYQGDMASLRNRVITEAHQMLSTLLQAGMPPSPQAFLALVTLAGKLRVPDLLRVALQDAETARIDLGEIGIRTVLASAARVGATALIEEYWTRIVHKAASDGKQIGWKDWKCFAQACKRAGHRDYFDAQLRDQEHTISASSRESIMTVLEEEENLHDREIDISRPEVFKGELAGLNQQIRNIAAVVMSGQRLDLKQTPFYMFLDPERSPLAKREHLREIYDEFTIDPHQPPLEEGLLPTALSSTGIPYDELRFENWVSIVNLMDQAHSLEFERQNKVQLLGEDVARRERKNPLETERSDKQLSPNVLREHIKSLRDPSVRPLPINNNRKLIPSSHSNLRKVLSKTSSANADQPKPLNITKHTDGSFTFRSLELSPDAASPPLSQTKSPRPLHEGNHNELQLLYHYRGGNAVPARSDGAFPPPKSILPDRKMSRTITQPSLTYYAGIKSNHEAPAPRLSRRPLGRREKEG